MSTFYTDCKKYGMKVGAYHFLVASGTPEQQAQNFYEMIKDYEWDCVPMLDVETNFDGLSDYVVRFVNVFKQLSPLTLGIYSYTSFLPYIESASEIIKDMPFWEANYNLRPWNLSNTFFTNRVGHQYTSDGKISGITSEGCDLDSFTEGVYLDNSTIAGNWIEGTGNNVGKWWYKHNDGSYTSNGWEKINGSWFHFSTDGWMEYDWKKDGNSWYFLGNSNDGSAKKGWYLTGGKWYYFDENTCAMITGWKEINSKWYYFDHTGSMTTGWIKDDGKDYLLYSDGSMAHDTIAYGYSIDFHGVATKL
jgi:hypothetical protein